MPGLRPGKELLFSWGGGEGHPLPAGRRDTKQDKAEIVMSVEKKEVEGGEPLLG